MTFQPTPMCMDRYDRAKRLQGNYVPIMCSNPAQPGNNGLCEGPHSWQRLYDSDSQMLDAVAAHLEERQRELEAEEDERRQNDGTIKVDVLPIPGQDIEQTVLDVCEAIEAGELDDYIELILEVGHSRKRARRGVRQWMRVPQQYQ